MKSTSLLLGLTLTITSLAASEPLKVKAIVPPKPYYVGQAIELMIEVDSGDGSPTIEVPRTPNAQIFPMPIDSTRPSTAKFLVVPSQAGSMVLPSFHARSGDRSGASKSSRILVASVPTEGRTSNFLGGVGPFEVHAEAKPLHVRPGETFEFRILLTGPAAFGSVRGSNLNEWATPTLTIEAMTDFLPTGESPVRTFRYRMRPLKSGRIVLPPVAIAAFDPTTRHYATRATSGITIQVEELTQFDPNRMIFAPIPWREAGSRLKFARLSVAILTLVSGSALTAWFVARHRRRSRTSSPRKLALELLNGLQGGRGDEVEAACAVAEALTTFLFRVGSRAPGVLTPPEARVEFQRLTDDPRLGTIAESLILLCDRVRFGMGGSEVEGTISEGRSFFEALIESMKKEKGNETGPGEAVGTALKS